MGRKEIIIGAAIILIIAMPLASCAGLLTAADWDDNNNYWHFEDYLDDIYDRYSRGEVPRVELKDRVSFLVTDKNGDGLPNPHLTITPSGSEIPIIDTYGCYDGWFRFFPKLDGDGVVHENYVIRISPSEDDDNYKVLNLDLDELGDDRKIEVQFEDHEYRSPDALDLAFVVDTTGSMGDELAYLTKEFENIVSSVREQFQVNSMRFGLVVYRDMEDEYVTRSYGFTDSIQTMQNRLEQQSPNGGGDYEEAVELGLRDGIDLDWRDGNTARMMFHVADAPPHQEKMDETLDQILRARDKGIHIYPLASSGIQDIAEFTMRLSGILAHGRYLFLTDDSGVGNPHAEPHIPAYYVTTLEDLMVRLVESELRGKTVEPTEEQIIRRVGVFENGTVTQPDDNEQTDPSDPGNETQPPSSNETGNGTGPGTDPPLEGDGGHDYPDDSEYPSPPGLYDGTSDSRPDYYDADSEDRMYASYVDDDDAYAESDSGGFAADSPFSSIWIIILGAIGLILILSSSSGVFLRGSRKR